MSLVAALVLIGFVLIVPRALDREIRAEESQLSSRFAPPTPPTAPACRATFLVPWNA